MRKRLTVTITLAASAVAGILIFQCYWVYSSYRTSERNFKSSILTALWTSIDAYPLQVTKLPSTLADKQPYLTVLNEIIDSTQNRANPTTRMKGKTGMNLRMDKMTISPDRLKEVQEFVATLIAESSEKPMDMTVLTTLFKNELEKKHIIHPFTLKLLKNQVSTKPEEIASFIPFSKTKDVIVVEISDIKKYLLKQNILPALLSLLLIVLSAGSLYYMGIIIRRQVQMDGIKNDFINNVTHELRTPISILKSSHELLLHFTDLSDTEKTKRHLQTNVDVLNKLDKNVDRILEITRYEKGITNLNYQLTNVDQLVDDVIRRFSSTTDNVIQYESALANKLISTDAYIIDTVLTNLIDNAIKYTKDKTIIHISATTTGSDWQLKITDNGIGISEQDIPFIFEKFYRVQSGNIHDVKGYGLGLSYVNILVRNLNGSITVKSKLGEGTSFIIKFPLHEQN